MLDDGDPAPDFDLDGTAGDSVGTYRLSAAASQAPVLVAFYADDVDPASRAYLEALRDTDWGSLTDAIALFGVAPGSLDEHRELAMELDLPFPLLVDHAGVDSQFGVLRSDGRSRIAAFLVDQRCRVTFSWCSTVDGAGAEKPDITPIREAVAAR